MKNDLVKLVEETLSVDRIDFRNVGDFIGSRDVHDAMKTDLRKVKKKFTGERYVTKREQWYMDGGEWYLNAKVDYPEEIYCDFSVDYDMKVIKERIAKELENNYEVDKKNILKSKDYSRALVKSIKSVDVDTFLPTYNMPRLFDQEEDIYDVLKDEIEVSSDTGDGSPVGGEINSVYAKLRVLYPTYDVKNVKVSGNTMRVDIRATYKTYSFELERDIDIY